MRAWIPARRAAGLAAAIAAVVAVVLAGSVLAGCGTPGPARVEQAGQDGARQQAQSGVAGEAPVAVVGTPAGSPDASGYSGVELDEPYAMPKLTFTDTSGRPFDLARRPTSPVTLVFFGYTSCPDVCNEVLADVAMALRRAEPSVRKKTRLVFVTTDPKRDTPAVMRQYLDQFDPAFIGLTGPLPVIEEAADSLGVALTGEEKLPGGGYEVGHGAQLIGFAPDGLGRVVWLPDRLTVAGLRADLGRLAGLPS